MFHEAFRSFPDCVWRPQRRTCLSIQRNGLPTLRFVAHKAGLHKNIAQKSTLLPRGSWPDAPKNGNRKNDCSERTSTYTPPETGTEARKLQRPHARRVNSNWLTCSRESNLAPTSGSTRGGAFGESLNALLYSILSQAPLRPRSSRVNRCPRA